jgi:heptosyltransferase III
MQIQDQLVPTHLLEKSDKILFVTHLALGDFTYLQNCFKAFHEKYPHLKIDLWVDEARGKSPLLRWNSKKSKYVLYDWLQACGLFNKVYRDTTSWWQLASFIKEKQKDEYPIVISLCQFRCTKFTKFARKISPKGFVIGLFEKFKKYQIFKKNCSKKLNAMVFLNSCREEKFSHICQFYAFVFEKMFGVNITQENRIPYISFPKKWSYFGKLRFLKWGIHRKDRPGQKTVFINAFAKNKKRVWPFDNVFELVTELQKNDIFYDARFIINVLPAQYKKFEEGLKNFSSKNIFLFTADFNFFQLPSIMSLCDLVISVETSIIHFAAALKIPVVVLMRKKNPEWIPYGTKSLIIQVKNGKDLIKNIKVLDVVEGVKSLLSS